MTNFTSHKLQITKFLVDFLKQKQQDLKNSYFSADVFERLLPLATSGKMLRGSLLINTYERLSGQKYSPAVLRAAAALELAGTSFLIHDDIIDQDELRRGQETLHHQYAGYAKQKNYKNSKHFGESLAICIGDLVFFLAYELLPANLVRLFSQQLTLTALGEMHDVELALMDGRGVTKENVLQMYLDKTASYSVSLPLMAGATLVNQSEVMMAQFFELGQTLGLIFQMKDDELGLFGDKNKIGKSVGADIREGKKTLYYYYLEQVVPGSFGGNGVEAVLSLMKNHQIEELVNKDVKELESKARGQLEQLQVNVKTKEMLEEFLEMNLSRKK